MYKVENKATFVVSYKSYCLVTMAMVIELRNNKKLDSSNVYDNVVVWCLPIAS